MFKAFPSIEQFRTVIKKVTAQACFVSKDEDGTVNYDRTKPIPTLKYKGTVKLHGTNACVHFVPNVVEPKFQSRNNEITQENDNAGFVHEMIQKPVQELRTHFLMSDDIYIYGEWCGKGIQKGVDISELPKMFVIFDVIVNGERLTNIDNISLPEYGIYNINDFPTFSVEVDFNKPEAVQNTFVELTNKVEEECPVANHFGVKGVGEGIVWKQS